eukprot:758396-Hanusia_phi.AAC.3
MGTTLDNSLIIPGPFCFIRGNGGVVHEARNMIVVVDATRGGGSITPHAGVGPKGSGYSASIEGRGGFSEGGATGKSYIFNDMVGVG